MIPPTLPEGHMVGKRGMSLARCEELDELVALGPLEKPDPEPGPYDTADSIRAPIDRDRARIESLRALRPVPLSELGEGAEVLWTWLGYLCREHITLLTGLWKGGKTTLLAYLLRDFASGGELAGTIEPARVLVISEESKGLWARRRDDLGIGDQVHLVNRPFLGRPRLSDWIGLVDRIVEWIGLNGYGVVVFDTLASLWPVPDENDASLMMAALSPLHAITAAGAAVLLVHHPRKGDAGEGQASRGSGALTGFVDIIVELRRYDAANHDDRRRVLTAYSRFDETPTGVVIELAEGGYRTVGGKSEAKRDDRLSVIAGVLLPDPPGMTVDDIRDGWPLGEAPKPGRRTVQTDLKEGAGKGLWIASGHGSRGDPLRYRRADSIRASPPP